MASRQRDPCASTWEVAGVNGARHGAVCVGARHRAGCTPAGVVLMPPRVGCGLAGRWEAVVHGTFQRAGMGDHYSDASFAELYVAPLTQSFAPRAGSRPCEHCRGQPIAAAPSPAAGCTEPASPAPPAPTPTLRRHPPTFAVPVCCRAGTRIGSTARTSAGSGSSRTGCVAVHQLYKTSVAKGGVRRATCTKHPRTHVAQEFNGNRVNRSSITSLVACPTPPCPSPACTRARAQTHTHTHTHTHPHTHPHPHTCTHTCCHRRWMRLKPSRLMTSCWGASPTATPATTPSSKT